MACPARSRKTSPPRATRPRWARRRSRRRLPLPPLRPPPPAAAADAPPAARMRAAGAVIVAKTTMPDYGMLSSGLSSLHPLTRNPWNLAKSPGGSSAGGGAAAAPGYRPLHIGTDIGRPPRPPPPPAPPSTGRPAGPMTRSVADAAALMQLLSQPDARDSMSLPAQDIAWSQFDQGAERLRGLRIGLLLDAGCGLAPEPEVTA